MTAVRVLKMGGATLGRRDRVARAVQIVAAERALGPVALVVSAMSGTTDQLLAAARLAAAGDQDGAHARVHATLALVVDHHGDVAAPGTAARHTLDGLHAELDRLIHGVCLLREHSTAALDLILSFGERMSSVGMAALLQAHGVPALAVDARTLVHTDDRFGDALVDWPATEAALRAAALTWGDRVPVITGFLGRAPDGRTTTLGRNGSDYTATLVARALGAAEVQVWRDMAGVMTADPALVDEALPLTRMSFGEALELATFGARMFHPRTMIPLIASGIPMRIRNTSEPDAPGTLVDADGAGDRARATSVTTLEHQAVLDVQVARLDRPTTIGARVHAALDAAGVTVWMTTHSAMGQAISAVVPMAQADTAVAALERAFARELDDGDLQPLRVARDVTLLTLVGEAITRTFDVPGRLFQALSAVGVTALVIGQSASARSVSCVIPAADTRDAARVVHAAFNLTHRRAHLLVMGVGVVGRELLAQVRDQQEELRRTLGILPVVVGIATSRTLTFDPAGLDLAPDAHRDTTTVDGSPVTDALLDRLARLTGAVLVDCTAADGMEALYERAWARGIHVVGANKKPLTLPQARRDAMLEHARTHRRAYRYETTVGASLPVIATLQQLVRTGDTLRLVEGSFSGTLGYLTNLLMDGARVDVAVRDARAAGYTEPLPQDDLSGLDVARKAIILARELGLQVELDEVALTPLVPASVLAHRDLDAFLDALAAHADAMAAEVDALRADGRVLRYLARIDPAAPARGAPLVQVGPVGVAADHPAARLRGTEAFVAFTTRRYAEYPLLVQGAGAGGAVTAAGVLSDTLGLFERLI